MSYEPTEWKSGDVISSAKLNKMEQGIAAGGTGGTYFVNLTLGTGTPSLDKTWAEIHEASLTQSVSVVMSFTENSRIFNPVVGIVVNEETYNVYCINTDTDSVTVTKFSTDNENGYPVVVAP